MTRKRANWCEKPRYRKIRKIENLWKWLRFLKIVAKLWLESGTISFVKFAEILRGRENGSGTDAWNFTKSAKIVKKRTKSVLVAIRFRRNFANRPKNYSASMVWSSIASMRRMAAKRPLLKMLWMNTNLNVFSKPIAFSVGIHFRRDLIKAGFNFGGFDF